MAVRVLFAAMVLSVLPAGGCGIIRYVAYLLSPEPTRTVRPEYDALQEHSVAILIFADQKVQYEYPYVRHDLSLRIASELEKNVEGVQVVRPERVIRYQDEDIHWETKDKTELGRLFGCDYILYVALQEFSMREPGSSQIFHGRIIAEASLHQTDLSELQACVWRCEDLSVLHPKDSAIGIVDVDERRVLEETTALFAERLAKKFYKHKMRLE